MARRSLSLKRETLTELATADLAVVVGAADYTRVVPTLPVSDCLLRTARCPMSEAPSCVQVNG